MTIEQRFLRELAVDLVRASDMPPERAVPVLASVDRELRAIHMAYRFALERPEKVHA